MKIKVLKNIDKSNIRISSKREYTRRNSTKRRTSPINTFWNKVINGMKKFLSPAFKK
jgi:hypothetical protein